MSPDDVVSAIHFSQLGAELSKNGIIVDAWPGNRSRRKRRTFPNFSTLNGVNYHRVFDISFNKSNILRLISSLIVQFQWFIRIMKKGEEYDKIIIGSDPIFSTLFMSLVKKYKNSVNIIYWVFDLHPEASIALGYPSQSLFVKLAEKINKTAYHCADKVFVVGECMGQLIKSKYKLEKSFDTIIPWSLLPEENHNTKLIKSRKNKNFHTTILYSGNYGKAHDLDDFLRFAKFCRNDDGIKFYIAGNALEDNDVKNFIFSNKLLNVEALPFVDFSELRLRIESIDYHWVSVRENFSGIVVPSKFFSAVEAKRGVIVNCNERASIWDYTQRYKLGYCVPIDCTDEIYAKVSADMRLEQTKKIHFSNSAAAHDNHFKKEVQVERFLRSIVES